MSAPPIPCVFLKGSFVPLRRAQNLAAAHYGEGEVVLLAPLEERSEASHDHQFAWLKEAWLQLPESIADQFPTPTHLRKRALIEAGYYDETMVDAGTRAAALRVAAFMQTREPFAFVVVRGPYAVMRTPKSQSHRAMGREDFQASKTAIMEIIANMIGVAPDQLARAAA